MQYNYTILKKEIKQDEVKNYEIDNKISVLTFQIVQILFHIPLMFNYRDSS